MSITFRQTTDSRGTNKGSALNGSEYDNTILSLLNNGIKTYESISDIRALNPSDWEDKTIVYVKSYYGNNQKGGGLFQWNSSSTDTDNNGTIIKCTEVTVGRFLREFKDRYIPEDFGAYGDGTTDDTSYLQGMYDSIGYLNIPYKSTYRVVTSSGFTNQELELVADEFIIPNATYKVTGSSGQVTYAGTVYDINDTFTADYYYQTWANTGDASIVLVTNIALLLDDEDTVIWGSGKLEDSGRIIVDGDGIGIFCGRLNDTLLNKCEINSLSIKGSSGTDWQIGLVINYIVFSGEFSFLSEFFTVGSVARQAWNAHFSNMDHMGGDRARYGHVVLNANQQTYSHHFTQNFARDFYIEFDSAHGATVGNSVEVRDNQISASTSYTGEVKQVISSTELLLENPTKNNTTSLTVMTASIDGASAVSISSTRVIGGISFFTNSIEGLDLTATWQNDSEAGFKHIISETEGNIGYLNIRAHIEGPTNGIIIDRGSRSTSGQMYNVNIQASGFAGRGSSDADFGIRDFIKMDYVTNAKIQGYGVLKGNDGGYILNIGENCSNVSYDMDYEVDLSTRKLSDLQGFLPKTSINSQTNDPKTTSRTFPIYGSTSSSTAALIASISTSSNFEYILDVKLNSRLDSSYSGGYLIGTYVLTNNSGTLSILTVSENSGNRNFDRIPSITVSGSDIQINGKSNGSDLLYVIGEVTLISGISGSGDGLNSKLNYN